MNFELSSPFSPTGDQPEAIAALSDGIKSGVPFQTLLGVTGSGKTFTIANVIKEVRKPTLILSHNKTLAAQLYSEFKAFFPNNAVEYFVSYYDYYQPEAYLPTTDTYMQPLHCCRGGRMLLSFRLSPACMVWRTRQPLLRKWCIWRRGCG